MRISVSEDIDMYGDTISELIVKLKEVEERIGSDATVLLYEQYGSFYVKLEYYREETGPEQSSRINKELANTELRRQKYLRLKEEFNPTSGEH